MGDALKDTNVTFWPMTRQVKCVDLALLQHKEAVHPHSDIASLHLLISALNGHICSLDLRSCDATFRNRS